jgi:UDP-N-acetylglucosamine 2-epimerase (non-hydrolysing)
MSLDLILTDSGGIREETTALGFTIFQATNLLIGTDPVKIVAAVKETLDGKAKAGRIPALWDGRTAGRIVEILLPRRKSTIGGT